MLKEEVGLVAMNRRKKDSALREVDASTVARVDILKISGNRELRNIVPVIPTWQTGEFYVQES
jgi:hypothetical protein